MMREVSMEYQEPKMEVVWIEEDIITSSGGDITPFDPASKDN